LTEFVSTPGASRELKHNQPQNLEVDDNESQVDSLLSSSAEDDLANFRYMLNTKRDHLILITQVNDALVTELISSGVINAESDFTENEVRRKSPY
jgi:hypothetical protein